MNLQQPRTAPPSRLPLLRSSRRDAAAPRAYFRLRSPKHVDPEPRIDDDGHRLVLHPPTGLLVKVPVDPRTNAPSSPQDELLCKYKGSHCSKPRSLKRNRELHNLCELHRERAKANQGRFDARLRQRRRLDQSDLLSEDGVDLPEPIRVSDGSPTQPLDEWEAELLLETMQDIA